MSCGVRETFLCVAKLGLLELAFKLPSTEWVVRPRLSLFGYNRFYVAGKFGTWAGPSTQVCSRLFFMICDSLIQGILQGLPSEWQQDHDHFETL